MIETVRVLLIEDNADFAASTALLLEERQDAHFQVRTAGSVKAALDHLGKEEADVILLDLNLPNGKGIETLRKIQSASDVPIVVLTGLKPEEIDYEASRMGVEDFVIKTNLETPGDWSWLALRLIKRAIEADTERRKRQLAAESESSLLKLKELTDSVDVTIGKRG